MDMVGHEAVRDNCELFVVRRAKNLRQHEVDNRLIDNRRWR
jgi:hypothetical protein